MLKIDNTMLLLVDIQGNLAQAMHDKENLFKSIGILIQGVQQLRLPIVWAEQIPSKLGPTIGEVADLLPGLKPISKSCFSCCRNPDLMGAIEGNRKGQVLIAGIEAHICVYQTAADLLQKGYEVNVVGDAVSSRTASNKAAGLALIQGLGGTPTSVEACLFELLGQADGEAFRQIVKLVK